jgi:hypothetical protein
MSDDDNTLIDEPLPLMPRSSRPATFTLANAPTELEALRAQVAALTAERDALKEQVGFMLHGWNANIDARRRAVLLACRLRKRAGDTRRALANLLKQLRVVEARDGLPLDLLVAQTEAEIVAGGSIDIRESKA